MSKAILLSIKPEWLAKILNREKTIEVRKLFPKDYVGWVYIYVTKGSNPKGTFLAKTKDMPGFRYNHVGFFYNELKDKWEYNGCYDELNGKVAARFWCDKVEEIKPEIWTSKLEQEILKGSCLTENELFKYISKNNGEQDNPFFAIHIYSLDIFDRPKELCEFRSYKVCNETDDADYDIHLPITKAPQNYCYIEGEQL